MGLLANNHLGEQGLFAYLSSRHGLLKNYVGVWVESMITSPMLIEGTYDASIKTSTSTGEAPGPDGKPMKVKLVTKMPDNDHQTFDMYMIGGDGKETKTMTIEYTRRKK